MLTKKSTIKEVYSHPLGKDFLNLLVAGIGHKPSILKNPIVGSIKLSTVAALLGKEAGSILDTLLKLLEQHSETAPPSPENIARKWWKEAVVYQIYPRSFQDSDGDGIGDLEGIKQRIPYLKELGVDVVWLSPIYDSPNDDNGYDIRDYRKIMKEFGTMEQFDSLLRELHKNGIKLIMDLVVNHTSDEHEWFKKALEDAASPYKDYYIWKKGQAKEQPPNNWLSCFGGEAWNYYPEQEQWALHLFSKKQMDLNWENPVLRVEIYDMINWWLDKGIDGFRLDVINLISKNSFEDGNEALNKMIGFRGIEHHLFGRHLHEYLREMNSETFSKYDVFTVGETPGLGMEMCKLLTAEERKELDLVFNFDVFDTPGNSRYKPYEYDLRYLKTYFTNWQQNYGNNCWQSLVFENHDNPRMLSKVTSNPSCHDLIAKLLAMLQLTLKGTPFIYQGQELGMSNMVFSDISQMRDVDSIQRYNIALNGQMSKEKIFDLIAWSSRDHARTPMQWDDSVYAGFTSGTPWIDINPNYTKRNAKAERKNPESVFTFFTKLIALRKSSQALIYGDFKPAFAKEKDIFCYYRLLADEKYYIEINLTDRVRKHPGPIPASPTLVAGNYEGIGDKLRPYEANLYKCNDS